MNANFVAEGSLGTTNRDPAENAAYTRASDPMDVLSRNRKLEVPDRLEFTLSGHRHPVPFDELVPE